MSTHPSPDAKMDWRRFCPPTRWWRRVNSETVKADLLAGLTGAIVVLPQGVAFAAIAGMPPVYGLYTGMIPAIIAALLGSSWHLVSGPTTAASIVLYSLLSFHAEPGTALYVQLAISMTFLVGLTQLALGLARMGVLVNFVSHAVVIGFTSGAALLIATNQIRHFTGIPIPKGSDFAQTMSFFYQNISEFNPHIVTVSLSTLLAGIVFRRLLPRIPYMVLALGVGTLLAWFLDPTLSGASGISRVDPLPASLPPLSLPDLSWSTLHALAPGVVAVTMLALTEAISIARAMAMRSGQVIDADQEFIAQGFSNIIGSFFSAYVATGSFNRSGLNFTSGARTPLAAAFSGIFLILLVTQVADWAAYLPHAAMAGVLILVAWGLVDWQHIVHILHTSRPETAIMLTTFFATLFFNLESSILFGVMLSVGLYLARTSHPNVISRIPDPTHPTRRFALPGNTPECPHIRLVWIDGSLFFAAVGAIRARLEAMTTAQTHLVIVASGINCIDLSGAEFLAQEALLRRNSGGGLYLVRLKETPLNLLKRGGYLQTIGEENLFGSKSAALKTIFSRLDAQLCQQCRHPLFQECPFAHPTAIHYQQETVHSSCPL
ncbi:SulP family inorganic anion transporter [Candidatus Magnetaquicoccus inordinatus]|uniref:SulP family inorganic anion transporter n=1 Tax=Candidatus Magnetaquicoccus inordinatus TaxID=2496818 RepID=UPI001D0DD0C0|nr:SulP family inorganic anion transporter [Candidatus Magnetaquicoccus inordinatus]